MVTATLGMLMVLHVSASYGLPSEDVQQKQSIVREDSTNNTDAVVSSIRRQLMADNYDYMPSASEEGFLRPAATLAGLDPPATYISTDQPPTTGGPPLGEHVNDIFMPRARDMGDVQEIPDVADAPDPEQSVHKNDLLYYVHDDRLRAPPGDEGREEMDKSSKPKYKILKLQSRGDTRRAGEGGRFLQEEWEGGVAIVSLDGRPFPQFTLPPARRRYRGEGADLVP